MINIKRFICVFVCIILVFSVSFSSFAVAGETDADYIKGVISSLATICGFQFDSWSASKAFSNNFYNKIMNEQTDSQMSFLASIPNDFHSSEINNNFVGVDVNSILISNFLSALVESYPNLSFDNNILSGTVSLPYHYYWGENISEERIETSTTTYIYYTFDDYLIDVSSLSDGLHIIGKNLFTFDNSEPIYYVLKRDGYYCFLFSVGDYYFRFNTSNLSVVDYPFIKPCFALQRIDYSTSTPQYTYLTLSSWNPFGGSGYYYDSNLNNIGHNIYYILPAFLYYDSSGTPKGRKELVYADGRETTTAPFNSSDFFYLATELNLSSLFDRVSTYCSIYELYTRGIIFDEVSTPGTHIWAKNLYYSTFEIQQPIFSGTDWGVGYSVPIYFSDNELTANGLTPDTFLAMTFSYAFCNSVKYSLGALIDDAYNIFIKSQVYSDSDSLYNKIQDESLLVRVPINLDRLSEDDSVTLKPDVEDIPWDGESTEGGSDEEKPGSGTGGDNPFDSPDLDDSTVLDFLNDFIEGPKKFFKFLSDMWASLPNEISYVVMGSLVLCVGIGAVKLVI